MQSLTYVIFCAHNSKLPFLCQCCRYYPNGDAVESSNSYSTFFVTRRSQELFLQRSGSSQYPTGVYCCEIDSLNETVAVNETGSGDLSNSISICVGLYDYSKYHCDSMHVHISWNLCIHTYRRFEKMQWFVHFKRKCHLRLSTYTRQSGHHQLWPRLRSGGFCHFGLHTEWMEWQLTQLSRYTDIHVHVFW